MGTWPIDRLSPCGTAAANRRHQRNGEKPCPACLEAGRQDAARRKGHAGSIHSFDPRPIRNGIPWKPYIYQGTGVDAWDGSDLFEEAS